MWKQLFTCVLYNTSPEIFLEIHRQAPAMETFSIKLYTKACKLTKNHRHFSLDLEEYFIAYHNIFTGCPQATASVILAKCIIWENHHNKIYWPAAKSYSCQLNFSRTSSLGFLYYCFAFIHRTEYKLERFDWVISKANISFIHTNKCLWMGDLLQ